MADGLCVSLYCVQGPPSPAAGAGFKEHPWREDILGKQHETDLERAGARYITYKVIISCKGDRGVCCQESSGKPRQSHHQARESTDGIHKAEGDYLFG